MKQRERTAEKYGPQADRWSEEAYADSDAYLAHRAELVVSLGPKLAAGDTVVDLACGDGGLARFLPDYGYLGVDASPEMVEAGRRGGREVVLGDLNDYVPPEPVAATTCFRAIYYARDRAAFFRHVSEYTQRKLVFDLNPRVHVRGEAKRAFADDDKYAVGQLSRPASGPVGNDGQLIHLRQERRQRCAQQLGLVRAGNDEDAGDLHVASTVR